jgi:hypothetical protein
VTVAILAEAPGPACLAGLAPRLDAAARRRLQLLLIARAVGWAAGATRGDRRVLLVLEGGAADDAAVVAALPAGVQVVAAGAPARLPGPVLLAGAAWPRVGPEHAAAAWADLDAGAAAVYGPALDGGAYLLALAEPPPGPLALPAGPGGLGRAMEAARMRGEEIGLLRHERALADVEDLAAFMADPRLAPELRAALAT